MDSFLLGPHCDELDSIAYEEAHKDEDEELVDVDFEEFNTCFKEGVDDRKEYDDIPF
jgi:hypothetical protein